MSKKKAQPVPVWFKNTFFWIAGILFLLAVVGLIAGDNAIRDPGQKRENGLVLFYLVSSVVMFVNGWISHQQAVQIYNEEQQGLSND